MKTAPYEMKGRPHALNCNLSNLHSKATELYEKKPQSGRGQHYLMVIMNQRNQSIKLTMST